ncbi:PrgI family protein [Candidatus Saccharibacteria bacterium]|nr:PrgI family protein [Candidatus Saccharibacteria bacterium]
MAVYKVPQDVEADDKLIGPFSFRQFVYLLIAAGLVALAVGLFQIFPLLAILPLPPVLLFLALALPIKKDQPMETYLAALVSYYIKPRTRVWTPGQRESTILITAPKIVEDVRTRDISEEEATHRLSFLADIVDSQGYAIKGATNNNMRDDLVAEANATADMFDNYRAGRLSAAVERNAEDRHAEIIRNMRAAIERNESKQFGEAGIVKDTDVMRDGKVNAINPLTDGGVVTEVLQKTGQSESGQTQDANEKVSQKRQNDSIIELANNTDFTVATIEKEANRIKRKDEGEVFISLH